MRADKKPGGRRAGFRHSRTFTADEHGVPNGENSLSDSVHLVTRLRTLFLAAEQFVSWNRRGTFPAILSLDAARVLR
jgi:hypothetical protein